MDPRKCPKCGCENDADARECDSCGLRRGDEPDYLAESVGKVVIGLGAIMMWIAATAVTLFVLYQFYSCSPLPGVL